MVGQGRTLSATVEGNGFTPTGDVEFKVDGVAVGTATLEEGEATFSVCPFNAGGRSTSPPATWATPTPRPASPTRPSFGSSRQRLPSA